MNRWFHVEIHIDWSTIIEVVIVRPTTANTYNDISPASLARLVDLLTPHKVATSVNLGEGHWIYGGIRDEA